MTGYGKADLPLLNSQWQIEMRAVNSKMLDFNPRLPQRFKSLEIDIRKCVSQQLYRGKIDIVINEQNNTAPSNVHVNKQTAMRFYGEIQEVAEALSISLSNNIMGDIMRMPEVVQQSEDPLSEEDLTRVLQAVEQACVALNHFREQEGSVLQADFQQRLQHIRDYVVQIEPYREERINKLRQRFAKELEKTFGSVEIDRNRMEQEMIFYIEKLDITEEIVRLGQHITYFEETMQAGDGQGKKLNFIAQEMGREINTIGSKANNANIQHIVVNMKDELEKIKEQMLNIL